ncbi:MAG: TetR/AcrR family transcriptional regulator [Rhizobiaceae bacterium]|nr:TetR/AcrR family transcriptional regulator [Rhizobiaceae bacterium]
MKSEKRKAFTRQKREKEIIAAALTVFCRSGYSATRMDDIASEVGLSKPAIYIYFDNKEALFKAVIMDVAHQNVPMANDVLNTEFESAAQRLSVMIDLLYDSMSPDRLGILFPLISETTTHFPELAGFFKKDVFGQLDALVLDTIKLGVEQGEFHETAASTQVELIIGPALSFGLRRLTFQESHKDNQKELEAFKKAHLHMLLSYLTHPDFPDLKVN